MRRDTLPAEATRATSFTQVSGIVLTNQGPYPTARLLYFRAIRTHRLRRSKGEQREARKR